METLRQNINSIVADRGYRAPWQRHKNRWLTCQDCGLGKLARNHCLLRCCPPAIPFEVFFVGEAPGPSENNLGSPFVGLAGRIQQELIDLSQAHTRSYSYGIANLLACRPYDPNSGKNFREPTQQEIETCHPRIMELYKLVQKEVKVVVLLGEHAQNSPFGQYVRTTTHDFPIAVLHCWHPSYINRSGGVKSYNFCKTLDHLVDCLSQTLYQTKEVQHAVQKSYRRKRIQAIEKGHRKSPKKGHRQRPPAHEEI